MGRHQALRISVPRDEPLAVVWRRVDVPWAYEDRLGHGDAAQDADLAGWLERDRKLGVDIDQAPLMRVTVICTAPDRHELVWSCHHLFLDGWSAAIVLDEVMHLYRAETDPVERLEPAPPLQAYYRWARELDPAAAEAYWRERLAGFDGRAALGGRARGTVHDHVTVTLDRPLSAALAAAGAALQVPANTLLQGAWALVLSRMLGSDDVVYGAIVAGRSAGVDGLDRMVGNFSNLVPVRARVDRTAIVRDWLRAQRDAQFEMQPVEHASLADIHAWSEVPGHRSLFQTVLAVETFRVPDGSAPPDAALRMEDFRSDLTSSFPVTVAAMPGERWRIVLRFDEAILSPEQAGAVVRDVAATLEGLVRRPDDAVGSLLDAAHPVDLPRAAAPGARGAPAIAPGSDRPADEVEMRLAEIWEKALGIEAIGVHDDFFELGDSSITGVRLFTLVEDAFATRLPLSTLFSGTTISAQARLLRGDAPPRPSWRYLVPIQPAGSQPPIACVHPSTGDTLFYRALARELGPDQPVFGIEPIGLDGREAPLESVEAMAANYVEELRAAHPEGPYRLVGYCFGAVLSLEMARQLEDQAQRVDLVVAIDPPFARAQSRWERAADIFRNRGATALVGAALRKLGRRARVLLHRHGGRVAVSGAARRRAAAQHRLVAACDRAFDAYDPRPCAAPIALIRSAEMTRWTADLPMDWEDYTTDLRVRDLDGPHREILADAAAGQMAQIIEQELARTPGRAGES